MFVSCWSVKGGSGTTVVAVSLAVILARSSEVGVLVVDLAGDVPAVLGVPDPVGPGVAEWLGAGSSVPVDGLARLEVAVSRGIDLVSRGAGSLSGGERAEVLAGVLGAEQRAVVVDCGLIACGPGASTGGSDTARVLAASATHSLLVTRPCYLSLRRAAAAPLRPSGVVLVTEEGRALRAGDVEDILDAPVVASVSCDPSISRAVDAGLLAGRLPRELERALRRAA